MSVKVKDLIEKVRLRIVYGSDDLLEKERWFTTLMVIKGITDRRT